MLNIPRCTGNLWFGECGVLHCSLWAVQTINFPYAQHARMQLKSTVYHAHQHLCSVTPLCHVVHVCIVVTPWYTGVHGIHVMIKFIIGCKFETHAGRLFLCPIVSRPPCIVKQVISLYCLRNNEFRQDLIIIMY